MLLVSTDCTRSGCGPTTNDRQPPSPPDAGSVPPCRRTAAHGEYDRKRCLLKPTLHLLRSVVDLLYSVLYYKLYDISATNNNNSHICKAPYTTGASETLSAGGVLLFVEACLKRRVSSLVQKIKETERSERLFHAVRHKFISNRRLTTKPHIPRCCAAGCATCCPTNSQQTEVVEYGSNETTDESGCNVTTFCRHTR